MELELTPSDEDVDVEVSLERISEELGEQGILGDVDNDEFLYLAALALETHENDDYDIVRTLMEFLRNSSAVNADMSDCEEIEVLLQ